MAKVTNKGQLTSSFNRQLKQYVVKQSAKSNVDWNEIKQECNKPLQSKFAVEAHGKLRMEWAHHNTMNNRLRTHHFGNTWYEVDRAEYQFHEVGSADILREQQRLYNKLKREYEKAQNDMVTEAEKVQAVTRNKSIKLLNGLTCSPNYDRIYKEV